MSGSLENFDAIGRWRDRNEAGGAIDFAGTLPTGATFANPADLKRLLAGREADLARNLTGRFMAYALGRQLEGYDEVVLNQLMARIAEDGYRVRTIFTDVITSDLFTHRSVCSGKRDRSSVSLKERLGLVHLLRCLDPFPVGGPWGFGSLERLRGPGLPPFP